MKLIKKIYFNIFLPIFYLFLPLFIILLLVLTISKNINTEDSVVSKLATIDFGTFFLTFTMVYSGLIVSFFFIQFLLIKFSKNEIPNDNLFLIFIKFSYVGALITTMLVSLTSEQFDILISTLSFIGIFSFVIPKNFFNKFINSNHDKKI